MNHLQKHFSASLIALAALLAAPMVAWAAAAPNLGAASTFGALGGAGVTCDTPPVTPVPTVTGNVGAGLGAASMNTGFPNLCSLSGTVQGIDTTPSTVAAYANFMTAYTSLASNLYQCPAANNLNPGDLSNGSTLTLAPGVYCIGAVANLTGKLTLDPTAPNGDGGSVWIFKGGSITPSGGGSVVMAGGGNACNVYWQLATTATFSGTTFVGNILAGTAITFTGSSLAGRALAQADVTMTASSSITSCGATQPPTCDKNNKDDKHCDGDHDGHDGDHDGHDGNHDGHDGDKDGHHSDYHNNPFGSNDDHSGDK
jgi:Ice-binding-like